jgi:hypothetical protein
LPLVKRSNQERFANNPSIIEVRKRVEKLAHSYKIQKSSVTRKHLAAAKQRLNEEYNRLEGDCLKTQIEEAELAFHVNNAQVLALRRIIEGVKKKNIPAILTFIDFSKAFDSIGLKAMFEFLKAYGIPPHIRRRHTTH